MVEKAAFEIENVQLISDEAAVETQLLYSFDRVKEVTIVLGKGDNAINTCYTDKAHPSYSSGDTTWVVDTEGKLHLQVRDRIYPKESIALL